MLGDVNNPDEFQKIVKTVSEAGWTKKITQEDAPPTKRNPGQIEETLINIAYTVEVIKKSILFLVWIVCISLFSYLFLSVLSYI